MFVGHYGVSFAAKRTGVPLPLWVWFVAVQWLDFVFMTLVLCGVEKVRLVDDFTETNALDLYYMPYSHGLPGAVVMSLVLAGIVAAIFPAARRPAAFALVALASFSHWVLDLFMHTHDMPLYDNSAKVGFGLWDHLALGLALEFAVLILGAWLYVRSAPMTEKGARLVWGFVALLVVLHLVSTLGPTPPSPSAFAASALASYVLFAALAAWVERRAIVDHGR
jgi:hypothetical protein